MKRTSDRKKGMAAARLGTSTDSEDVPQMAKEGEPTTAQTLSSVPEDFQKVVTGRMPLTPERSVSQVEGSKIEKGQMSAERDSAESERPEKGSPARRRPASGSENRLSMLQREDTEEFGELFHEGKAIAPPIVRSFEEDTILKQPPPDFALSQEYWLGLHVEIREKLWQGYRLVNPTSITAAAELTRMVEAISRTRKELAEKKAREVFQDSKRAEPQRSAAPPPTNMKTSRIEVSAWVGSTSERQTAARWTPQPRGLRAKKLIAFRVGEGVPFSDCYRSFRTVVHDAKRDGHFATNFNIVQSIISVLMSQQYPTLYEITFPRNTPNRYFLDEAQMWKALDLLKRNMTRSLPHRSDTGVRRSSGGGAPGVGLSSAKTASKTSAAWVPESIMNVKKDIFKADFPSWPASMETWGAVYSIQNDRDPPLLARFSDHKTKPAMFRKFVGQCLNCLSDDGHNMRSCLKPFLNKSGLLNSKIGELPEPEKEAVWRRIQNRLKRKSQHRPKSHSTGNSQRRRNTDRSEVTATTDQTKKFVKTPDSKESSSN